MAYYDIQNVFNYTLTYQSYNYIEIKYLDASPHANEVGD